MRILIRHFVVVGLTLSFSTATASRAAELIMFYSPLCEWCEAWDREVGIVYSKTSEGRIAPLRRLDIDEPRPTTLGAIDVVIYTPTFVLMENGREVGRIVGYRGEHHFWGLLGPLLDRLHLPKAGTAGFASRRDIVKITS
ncbi:MAG: thioredoxin family protein [Gammaproteobacteria bacterium]|nr:thioredoxin family protein [Gammaproteobacteria bacterium]